MFMWLGKNILLRVWGSVNNKTDSVLDDWIYWHFFYNYNQLQQLTINDCRRRVSSLPLWRMTNGESLRVESSLMLRSMSPSASLSWNIIAIWGLWPDFYYCQTVAGLLIWDALSEEGAGLSFKIAACPRASAVILGSESQGTRDHILFSQIRDPFSSPTTTRRVTVEVFDPDSTREENYCDPRELSELTSMRTECKSSCLTVPLLFYFSVFNRWCGNLLTEPLPSNKFSVAIRCRGNVFTELLVSNRLPLWLHYSDS
jgi:hypothetical protein